MAGNYQNQSVRSVSTMERLAELIMKFRKLAKVIIIELEFSKLPISLFSTLLKHQTSHAIMNR